MTLSKIFFPGVFRELERAEKYMTKLMKTFREMNKLEDKVNRLELQIRSEQTLRNQLAARITALERKQKIKKRR